MADEDGEVVVTPLFQDVVAEVVVVATLVVDLYDVVRDDVLKDLVRADVDQVVVDGVDELLNLLVVDAVALVAELFVVALSDADLDVSSLVDILVGSLSLSHDVLFDADLDVSHLIDVVVAYLNVFVANLFMLLSISLLLNSISMLLSISLLLTDVMVLLYSLLCLLLSC